MTILSRRASVWRIAPTTLLVLLAPLALASQPPPAGNSTIGQMAELWVEPAHISSRDLFYGPGGKNLVPDPDVTYEFRKLDSTGHSKGYEVKDPAGRKWKVKVGEEAQAEIVVSRILWAIGYHQPVLHYVPAWRLSGGPSNKQQPGRFRLESDHVKLGDWEWSKNPFVGTRPYRGLVLANLLLNNWDLTTSNNRIYQVKGTDEKPSTWFVVQDVGGALGKTGWPVGSRNDVRDFESQEFVAKVDHGHVVLDYHARHRELLKDITPADVVWTCRLLAQLTDRQLNDAFRAAGYPPEISERYITKIKQKIHEGLQLEAGSRGAQ